MRTKRKYTPDQFFNMSISEFEEFYESEECRQVRDYIETRLRLELIEIIRRFKLNGLVQFEVRQKTYNSAYKKVKKEVLRTQEKLGKREYYLFEIVKDVVGARIICMDETIQKRVFEYILQIESLVIQPDGLEFYSAPFKEFTLSEDAHKDLEDTVKSISQEVKGKSLEKKSKESNYESLHFYVKFESRYDEKHLAELIKPKLKNGRMQRIRDEAEGSHLIHLYETASLIDRQITQKVPIEFQVRTITEHLWALEEHNYLYKPSSQSDFSNTDSKMNVLRSAFTGLKYAYYNVDRLRALIRNVSPTGDAPTYRGASKDFNVLRFRPFKASNPDIENEFRNAEALYVKSNQNLNYEKDGVSMIDVIVDLYRNSVVNEIDETNTNGGNFNVEEWGKKRLFYLFLAYLLMFTKTKKLTTKSAARLKKETGLIEFVGFSAIGGKLSDKHSMLKLVSTIYERISIYDGFARSQLSTDDGYLAEIFNDPLVGIRFASSFFLQGEFAGAAKALNDVFDLGVKQDLCSWNNLKLGSDFSLPETLMRHSQYIIFQCKSDDQLVDSFGELKKVFISIFAIDATEFSPELYHAYCWYYAILNYFFTRSSLVPEDLADFKIECRSYILKYLEDAKNNKVFEKIEVLLAFVYLPVHFEATKQKQAEIQRSYVSFNKKLEKFDAYPKKAETWIYNISEQLHLRAKERLVRPSNSTFISYSHEPDRDLAEKTTMGLITAGLDVAIDLNIKLGQSIYPEVEKAMADATSAILLISRSFFESPWTKDELAYLMERRRRKEIDLYLVLIDFSEEQLYKKAPLLFDIKRKTTTRREFRTAIEEVISEIKTGIEIT